MGNNESQLTKEELEDYKVLTYLSRPQIIHAFSRFKEFCPKELNADKYSRLSFSIIKEMPELENNPFKDRIGEIFSSKSDGCWSFEDFLDMVSVFNVNTPVKKKIEYAFRIYDFDGDGFLSSEDIVKMISKVIGSNRLSQAEMDVLLEKILSEADLDKDEMLSRSEFQHLMLKSPDFGSTFTIRI